MRDGKLGVRSCARAFGLLLGLVLCGCGSRAPQRDNVCSSEKPHVYTKQPLFASCHRIRTNESATDPATGATKHNIHRELFCCN